MQCEQVQARLSALFDGELSRVATWRVQRHLQGCSRCTAIRVDLASISTEATNLYAEVPLPTSLRSRFLNDASNASALTPVAERTQKRRRSAKRTVALAAGLVGLIGIGLGSASLYFSAEPSPAYAEIAQAMRSLRFKTIHLQGERTSSGKNVSVNIEYDVWGRTDVPAVASTIRYFDPSEHRSRLTQSVGKSTLRHFFPAPARKRATLEKSNTAKSLRRFLGEFSMNAFYEQLPVSGLTSGSSAKGMHWQSQCVTLKGQRLLRLEGTRGAWYLGADSFAMVVFYADPQTHLLARSEYTWREHGMEQRKIWREIRYDETPPAEVFEDAK